MPGGVRKSKRPSGTQQHKTQTDREKERKSLSGSMLLYLKRPRLDEDAGEGTSKNTAGPQTTASDVADTVSALHFVEEEGLVIETKEEVDEAEESAAEDSAAAAAADDSRESNVLRKGVEMFSDVSSWEIPVPDHFQVEIVRLGSASFQNKEGPFRPVARQGGQAKGGMRQLTKGWFYRTMPSGHKELRSWMVYSRVSGKLYCFCCRLFATSVTATTSAFVTGFQNWWKLSPKVENHERSEDHSNCLRKWGALAAGLWQYKTMDMEAVAAMENGKRKWRCILNKLLDITYLARQNMALRGPREDDSSLNNWNFPELVEMLSKYDAVLKRHLVFLKKKVQAVDFYLSLDTQNEFLGLLGDLVKQNLVMEIKSAEFFGIVFDSTPDLLRTDQMSEVIRFVKIHDRKVEIKQVCLGFFSLVGKKAEELCAEILEGLKRDGLDIINCRSQGYANAASTAGIRGGVQALIKENNPKAIFNGCIDHSLNMCAWYSFAENASSNTFLWTLNAVFSFFSGSPERWKVLVDHTGMTVKRLLTKHWSAHYAAVKPATEKFDEMVAALSSLREQSANEDTRHAAGHMWQSVVDFTFLCFLNFWCDVLQEVDNTQRLLQTNNLPLDKVVAALESLNVFLQDEGSNLVDRAIQHALVKAEDYGIPLERRVRFKKRVPGEKESDAGLTLQEENKRAMLECIAHFSSELQSRARGISDVAARFELMQARNLVYATGEELTASILKFTSLYDEISESDLEIEIPRMRRHIRGANIGLEQAKDWAVMDFVNFIVDWWWEHSLPTILRSLRLFVTVCESVTSCERSVSKFKRVKNYLRLTTGQARLSDLARLSTESELVKGIQIDKVINKFAALKSREGIC